MNKRIVIIAAALSCAAPACTSSKPEVATNPPMPESTDVQPTAEPVPEGRPTRSVNPPPQPTGEAGEQAAVAPAAPASFTGDNFRGRTITATNPHVDGKQVHRSSNQSCYVHGAFPDDGIARPPGVPPPQLPVDCPPEMNDAVYDLCHGGIVYMDADACGCFVMGNPPPPARALSRCPAHTATEETH